MSSAVAAGFPRAERQVSAAGRLRLLFASFPFLLALKFAALLVLKRVLGPDASLNFSQTGEDAIIRSLLDEHHGGFYVDVGCNDPLKSSNTLSLYLHGWRGLCIDANPVLIERFSRVRRRDIAVCAAVSDEEREMTFHEFDFDLVSTLSEEVLPEWRSKWSEARERKVRTRTLDALLDAHLPPNTEISLLSVDVEGHDLQVLRSIDLNRHRPKLIVVEFHHFDLRSGTGHDATNHLSRLDYEWIAYDSLNAYFIDRRSPRPGMIPR